MNEIKSIINFIKSKTIDFFKNGLVIKILSVFLAFVLWFVIISATNPILPGDSLDEMLEFRVEVMSKEVKNDGRTFNVKEEVRDNVTVYVTCRKEIRENTTLEDIEIELDEDSLSKIKEAGKHSVDLKVTCDKFGVSIDDYTPKKIDIYFDEIITKSIKVEVNKENISFDDGLIAARVDTLPAEIPVKGFKSDIEEISSVGVQVLSTGEIKGNKIEIWRPYAFLDHNGKEITDYDFETDVDRVQVVIELGKKVPLKCSVTGAADSGMYRKGEPAINPSYVIITAEDPELIKGIDSLDTEPVSIEGWNETVKQEKVKIILPNENIKLIDEFMPTVTVSFGKIIDKTINISAQNISINNADKDRYNYTIEYLTPDKIVINGKDEAVEAITATTLSPSISVKNLGAGTHEVSVNLKLSALSSDVHIKGNSTIYARVKITEIPAETSPTESPAGNDTAPGSNTPNPS